MADETLSYLHAQMKAAVSDGIREALTPEAARIFARAALDEVRQQATVHTGKFILDGVRGAFKRLMWDRWLGVAGDGLEGRLERRNMKRPTLIPEWRRVLNKAWSSRLMLVAGLLTGLEAVINAVGTDFLPVPKWARMVIILLVIGGAFVMRLVAQKNLGVRDGDQ